MVTMNPMAPMPDFMRQLPQDLRLLTEEQFEQWARWLAETRPVESEYGLKGMLDILGATLVLATGKMRGRMTREGRAEVEQEIINIKIRQDVAQAAMAIVLYGEESELWRQFVPVDLLNV